MKVTPLIDDGLRLVQLNMTGKVLSSGLAKAENPIGEFFRIKRNTVLTDVLTKSSRSKNLTQEVIKDVCKTGTDSGVQNLISKFNPANISQFSPEEIRQIIAKNPEKYKKYLTIEGYVVEDVSKIPSLDSILKIEDPNEFSTKINKFIKDCFTDGYLKIIDNPEQFSELEKHFTKACIVMDDLLTKKTGRIIEEVKREIANSTNDIEISHLTSKLNELEQVKKIEEQLYKNYKIKTNFSGDLNAAEMSERTIAKLKQMGGVLPDRLRNSNLLPKEYFGMALPSGKNINTILMSKDCPDWLRILMHEDGHITYLSKIKDPMKKYSATYERGWASVQSKIDQLTKQEDIKAELQGKNPIQYLQEQIRPNCGKSSGEFIADVWAKMGTERDFSLKMLDPEQSDFVKKLYLSLNADMPYGLTHEAVQNPEIFCNEILEGLTKGKKYGDEIMTLYNRYNRISP